MKRLFTALSLAACAAMVVAGPATAGVISRAEVLPGSPADIVPPPLPEGARDIRFNTGGEMFTPATANGSASGWSYYILHEYVPTSSFWWNIETFGFPTNQYSSDPIEMPVEWVADSWVGDIYAIDNPYSYPWPWRGDFYPAGDPDTSPPDTYTIVNVLGLGVYVAWDQTFVWGYENAGLCGQVSYNGVETIGWYVSYWDSDAPYGRTALMQFTAIGVWSPIEQRSLSAIKSLY